MDCVPIPEHVKAARPWAAVRPFGPPQGVADEDCGTAEVQVDPRAGSGTMSGVAHRLHWRPDEHEIAQLVAGGTVEVAIFGQVLPPSSVVVFGPAPPS